MDIRLTIIEFYEAEKPRAEDIDRTWTGNCV